MDRSTGDRAPQRLSQRLSRRALLGWGLAAGAGVVAAAGVGYALTRLRASSHTITDLYTYQGHTRAVNSLAWSPDGAHLVSSSWDGTVQVWDSATGQRLLTYSGHPQGPTSVAWSPDSSRLVSAGFEGSLQVWRAADGARVWSYQDYTYEPYVPNAPSASNFTYNPRVAWSAEGSRIATVGFPARLPSELTMTTMLWDATSGRRLLIYNDPLSQRVSWAPESARLATGGVEQTVSVWPAPLAPDAAGATPTATPDQNAAASGPYPAKIWSYHGDSAYVWGLAWSPDGARIASCGQKPIVLFASNGGVRIWDAATGRRVLTYTGHSSSVDLWALAWSPDGRYLASGGSDQVVRVWDARIGEDLATYYGHVDQPPVYTSADPYTIIAIAWSPDSTRLATSALNGPVRVWRISA
jgi:WD40 repeat protein